MMPARQRKNVDKHSDAAATASAASTSKSTTTTRSSSSKNNDVEKKETQPGLMKSVLGFEMSDISSFDNFTQLCHRPADPSCLAVFRILFGFLMVLDCIHERGLVDIVDKWSDEFEVCRFPLFDFLKPLPVAWMAVLYIVMGVGAAGISLGLFYRLSCLMFIIPYWYMFSLEKTAWNNHSYLFGLTATLLLFMDANRYWSIDAWRRKDMSNAHIPSWNYGLLRFQLVLVYFVAGLKKLDRDWVQGYSMSSLSYQWVFDPFRSFLTAEQIDQYIVHWGGLVMDLTVGFLLYLDQTRWLGAAMSSSFHLMNSRMFSIGQFPYVMLSTTLLFYAPDWPKKYMPARFVSQEAEKTSPHCMYNKDKKDRRFYHKFFAVFAVCVGAWQAFMPYSHFITQGYNGWAGGLYGYSWDMMVHNVNVQHVKIHYVSRTTGDEGYLDPEAFVTSTRWASHPDMVRQHARCIANMLDVEYGVPDVAIYMDIWMSMNKRFQQRIVDPTVDLVSVDWSPFRPASFLLPLLNDLEGWRTKLEDIAKEAKQRDMINWFLESPDTTFVADFPGMTLVNYLNEDLGKTNITLLAGSAVLQKPNSNKNETLVVNKSVRLGQGTHQVYVTSDTPACYMYIYSNTTKTRLDNQLSQLEVEIVEAEIDKDELEKKAANNETLRKLLDVKNERERNSEYNKAQHNQTFWEAKYKSAYDTYKVLKHSVMMSYTAMESLITGESMLDLVEQRFRSQKEKTES